jgi:phosphatidate cytidylyltransferase
LNNFIKRTLAGTAYIFVVIGALLTGPLAFYLVFATATCLAIYEFYTLISKTHIKVQKHTGIFTGFTIFTLSFLVAGEYLQPRWLLVIIPLILLVLIKELFRRNGSSLYNITFTLAGLIYPALSFAILSLLIFFPDADYHYELVIGIFVLIWTNDTFAYTIGKYAGRTKLFERISPHKSWEGLAGGFFFTLLASFIIARFNPYLDLWNWIITGTMVAVAGTFGDLFESLLKRSVGVKESGKLIPGHGGILDRFDSAIFVFPLVYVLLKLMN